MGGRGGLPGLPGPAGPDGPRQPFALFADIMVNGARVGVVAVPQCRRRFHRPVGAGADADLGWRHAAGHRRGATSPCSSSGPLRSGFARSRRRRVRLARDAPTFGRARPEATRSRRWPGPSTAWRAICRAARRRYAASDRARRQLLADVSHELMTPLSAIRGYVETLSMPELTLDERNAAPLPRHRRTKRPTSSRRSSATCWIWRGWRAARIR